MRVDDFIYTLMCLTMRRPGTQTISNLDKVSEMAGGQYDFHKLETPQKYSAGVETKSGSIQSLVNWLSQNTIESVRPVMLGTDNPTKNSPDYQLAGFLGTRKNGFEIQTHNESFLCTLEVNYSHTYLMKPTDFANFFSKLELPGLREKILSAMNEHFTLNHRPTLTDDQLESHLRSPEAKWIFDFIGSELVRIVQRFYKGQGKEFSLPSEFRNFFSPTDQESNFFFEDEIYTMKSRTPKHWKSLIEAQANPERIWKSIAQDEFINEALATDDLKKIKSIFDSDDEIAFDVVPTGNIFGIINRISQETTGHEPTLPEFLHPYIYKNGFLLNESPPADYIPQKDLLRLAHNTESFQVYFLKRLNNDWKIQLPNNPEEVYSQFRKSLKSAEDFAKKN